MQKMPMFAYGKQKGGGPGCLGEGHRKQVLWEPEVVWPSMGAGRRNAPTNEGCTLLSPVCVFLSFANVI